MFEFHLLQHHRHTLKLSALFGAALLAGCSPDFGASQPAPSTTAAADRGVAGGTHPAGATAQASVERFELSGTTIEVENIVGSVEIVASSGDRVVVEVTRAGTDAGQLEVDVDDAAARSRLEVHYPEGDLLYTALQNHTFDLYVRPRSGSQGGFNSSGGGWGSGLLFGRGEGRRIRSRGPGVEAWADLRIEVPKGRNVMIQLGAGKIQAHDLSTDLTLELAAGNIGLEALEGTVRSQTGSGHITLRDIRGSLDLSTGSGDITAQGVHGSLLNADTGSGEILLERIDVQSLELDTGSGDLRMLEVVARSLEVDTGSGDITLVRSQIGDAAIDTGSGDVTLNLVGPPTQLTVDTGSGAVDVRLPTGVDASIIADTGSGGINVDLPALDLIERSRDRVVGRLGSGTGRISLDTGSGPISIRESGE